MARRNQTTVKGIQQAALFPRAVVQAITRGRHQRIRARLAKEAAAEKAARNAPDPILDGEEEKE